MPSDTTMGPLVALGIATPEELRRVLDASLNADGPLQGGVRPMLLGLGRVLKRS